MTKIVTTVLTILAIFLVGLVITYEHSPPITDNQTVISNTVKTETAKQTDTERNAVIAPNAEQELFVSVSGKNEKPTITHYKKFGENVLPYHSTVMLPEIVLIL